MDYKEKTLIHVKILTLGTQLMFIGFFMYAIFQFLGITHDILNVFIIVVVAFGTLASFGGVSFDVIYKHNFLKLVMVGLAFKIISLFLFIEIYYAQILMEWGLSVIVVFYVTTIIIDLHVRRLFNRLNQKTIHQLLNQKAHLFDEDTFLSVRLSLRSISRMLFLGTLYFFMIHERHMIYHGVLLGIIGLIFWFEYKRQWSYGMYQHVLIVIHGITTFGLFISQFLLIHWINFYHSMIHWLMISLIFIPLLIGHIYYHTLFKNHVYKASIEIYS